MFFMLNVYSLICIHLNSAFGFSFRKLRKAYAFFNPIVDIMTVTPVFFFILAFVWQAVVSFQ